MALRALAFLAAATSAAARTSQNFDFGWKFHLGDDPAYSPSACPASDFPLNFTGLQCYGLSQAAASSEADCLAAACIDGAQIWQWCPETGCNTGPPGTCWIGNVQNSPQPCSNSSGWVSYARSAPVPYNPQPPPPLTCPQDFACPNYDDSAWRGVTLPHDFVVEGSPVPTADRNHGYLPFNVSFYRKTFTVPSDWQGQPVWLDFDGVYRSSDFWLNGAWIGHWESGYSAFRWWIHNATNATLYYGGQENVLAVRVDAMSHQEGWFYEGGGINRHVTINTAPLVNLVPWGIYAPSIVTGTITSTSAGLNGPQTASSALIPLQIDVQNSGTSGGNVSFTLSATLYDASGAAVVSGSASGGVPAGGWSRVTSIVLNVTQAQLWNLATPYLYTLSVILSAPSAGTIDSANVTLGIRSAIFDANQGFLLNGLPCKVQGFSNHQDFGGLGVAVPDRVNRYRVDLLKAIGTTGWRTAHNPVNSELLDYMDKAGMLVWAENRNLERQVIGATRSTAGAAAGKRHVGPVYGPDGALIGLLEDSPIDPSTFPDPQFLMEAAQLVLRDRNHPSIFIWSICNEGGCFQSDPLGGIVGSAFKNVILDIDGSRPVTANSEDYNGDRLTRVMDVESFSYNYGEYDEAHRRYPWKPVMGGEAASCTSDRGFFGPSNCSNGAVSANDFGCVVNAWSSAGLRSWVAGSFAWTGHDYKGEPSPCNWPCINSHFGVYDIAGFCKDSCAYYTTWWLQSNNGSTTGATPPAPTIALSPSSWTEPVLEGQTLTVTAFTAAASVQLWVNGASQGTQSVPYLGIASFPGVVYQPGNLTAAAFDASGKMVASTTILTVGPPQSLRLSADAGSGLISADGQDVALIRLEVVDAAGNVVPNASPNVTWTIIGPGEIVGLANGNPSDHTPDKVGMPDLPYGGVWQRAAYNGLARAIVRSSTTAGQISLTATATGMAPGSITIWTS